MELPLHFFDFQLSMDHLPARPENTTRSANVTLRKARPFFVLCLLLFSFFFFSYVLSIASLTKNICRPVTPGKENLNKRSCQHGEGHGSSLGCMRGCRNMQTRSVSLQRTSLGPTNKVVGIWDNPPPPPPPLWKRHGPGLCALQPGRGS